MTEFDKYYQQLNKAQKEAVDTVEGPVMVIAGPGTGKTQILTLRIANILLKTQVGPENVLALTFTEAGAKEMRRRLRKVIGTAADRVRLHTYHGFAGSIINEFNDHFPHLARAKQITEVRAESIIREILKNKKFYKLRPSGDPDLYVSKIIKTIGDCKDEAWTPEMLRSFAKDEIKRIESDEEWLSTRGPTKGQIKAEGLKRIEKCDRTFLLADIYESYEKNKRENKEMDFDDLILELISALREDKLLLQMLQEKYQYILIDEHQDTNDSQNALIKLIAEFFDNPNLFVVGDEKQAIYRFQGASVENFMSIQKKWRAMKMIRLEQNYRSQQNILDASFAMIENNYADGEYPELRLPLHSKDSKPKLIDVISAGNAIAADDYLIDQLKLILKNQSKDVSAVIVRRNSDVQRVLSLFEQNNIPASAERGSDIFQTALGQLFFSLLEYLGDPSSTEAQAYCLGGGLWPLKIDERVRLIKSLRSGIISEIEKVIPALAELEKEKNHYGAVAYLILAGELSGITDLARRDPMSSQIWRAIISLSEDLAAQNPDSPKELIKNLLDYRLSAGSRNIKISIGTAAAPIRVMTAHASKGLEFDNVFLPYSVEESWLPRGRGEYFVLPRQAEDDDNLRDERRLFYVALTRAKSSIFIISPQEDGGRQLTTLRFIEELDQSKLAKKEIPASLKEIQPNLLVKPQEKINKEIIDYANKILFENGLSVTALNHFMECPRRFYYKSILRIPEPPAASAEKGNAMHEAIANVWRLKTKTPKSIADTLKKAINEYFEKSLLPKYEKEPAVEGLIQDAPTVAAALQSHFSQTGLISTETRREVLFEEILLHGKLDVIIENKDKIDVFDYKTREAMSINSIKGNTKDGDGNYFRQLVFYKLLLSGDKKTSKKIIEPALVFVKPDSKGRCAITSLPIEDSDIDKVKDEIKTLIESVKTGKFIEGNCDDKNCEFCALRRLM